MKIFVINAGSSSIKYQLFDMAGNSGARPVCVGQIEKIGGQAEIKHTVVGSSSPTINKNSVAANHQQAMEEILELLTHNTAGVIGSASDIQAVGHRIVHGGEAFRDATIITEATKEKIRSLFSLAPLHNPVNYTCLELAELYFPEATQVAVFDTAFHQSIQDPVYRYAIPEEYYKLHNIRVYGFHGTSHKYVTARAAAWLGYLPEKIISLHLGNGCSATAIRNGQSVDTSMGFGPLAGLIMGTRSGDIDASVVFHLAEKLNMSLPAIRDLLNKQSGMAALAGTNDMRIVGKNAANGDAAAKMATEMYVYRIRKYIGAFAAAMNGVDAILFTGGVGENDSTIRELVCRDMDYLGLKLDHERNGADSKSTRLVSSDDSSVKVLVVPTNEEVEIAQQCFQIVTGAVG